MKRWLAFALVALIAAVQPFAYAQAETADKLGGTAIFAGEKIFYSGSVDGVEEGTFTMNLTGGDVQKIADTDAALMAYAGGNILFYNMEAEQVSIIGAEGNMVAQIEEIPFFISAIGGEGVFYAGNLIVDAATGAVTKIFEIESDDDFWMIEPVAVDGGYLYYLDQRQLGENAIEGDYCASLWRVPLAGGNLEQVMDTGVKYIGMDDQYVYIERLNFWYFDDEITEEKETDFETGLFRVAKDGSDAKKLCDTGLLTDVLYISYDILKDGIIYGIKRNYTDDDTAGQTIVSITVEGEARPEIPVEEDSLRVVLDDGFILARVNYVEDQDNAQKDQLVFVDGAGENKKILNENEPANLYYTEMEPYVLSYGGAVYYLGYNDEAAAEGLYRAEMDGSGAAKLAMGFIYPEYEEE